MIIYSNCCMYVFLSSVSQLLPFVSAFHGLFCPNIYFSAAWLSLNHVHTQKQFSYKARHPIMGSFIEFLAAELKVLKMGGKMIPFSFVSFQ